MKLWNKKKEDFKKWNKYKQPINVPHKDANWEKYEKI